MSTLPQQFLLVYEDCSQPNKLIGEELTASEKEGTELPSITPHDKIQECNTNLYHSWAVRGVESSKPTRM